jgi:hypothetical protein
MTYIFSIIFSPLIVLYTILFSEKNPDPNLGFLNMEEVEAIIDFH